MSYRLLVLPDRLENIGKGCPFACEDVEAHTYSFGWGYVLPAGSKLIYRTDGVMVGEPPFEARAWIECPTEPEVMSG